MLRPDFVVLARDLPETRLVVELKRNESQHADATAQIKGYMVARHCPIGLLITPTRAWLLRDTYEGSGVDAIREEGPYSTAELLGLGVVPDDEPTLALEVERWLERLTSGSASALHEPARRDLSPYLLPAVTEGRVASGSLG
jgi:hypothetical protein